MVTIERPRRTTNKPVVAIMNAVHDLPVLVARDEGYLRTRAWISNS